MMTRASIVGVFVVLGLLAGYRKDATTTAPTARNPSPPPRAPDPMPHAAANEVTLHIRKLGGADGKQLVNQMQVRAALDDDFNVTEQVGATQLELRGKVIAVGPDKFRVHYDYTETSATGRQKLKSAIELQPDAEKEIGGLQGAATVERVSIKLSRP